MDLKGTLESIKYSSLGEPIIEIKLYRTASTNEILQVEYGEYLKLKVSKGKETRSNRQNALMWAIITEIDRGMHDGVSTVETKDEIYCFGLEAIGLVYDDIEIPIGALPYVRKGARAMRILNEDGEKQYVRCFIGSSKYTIKEMSFLIDWFLRYAYELKIPIRDYAMEYQELFTEKERVS